MFGLNRESTGEVRIFCVSNMAISYISSKSHPPQIYPSLPCFLVVEEVIPPCEHLIPSDIESKARFVSGWETSDGEQKVTLPSVDPSVALGAVAATTSKNSVNYSPSLDSVKRFR